MTEEHSDQRVIEEKTSSCKLFLVFTWSHSKEKALREFVKRYGEEPQLILKDDQRKLVYLGPVVTNNRGI
jgi:hypothetical protein